MQGYSGAIARNSREGAGAKTLRLLINPPHLQLDDRTVIFKYTGDGGWFCASFGDGAKYMRAAKEDPTLRRRIEARSRDIRRNRHALGPDLARIMAAVELSKDYDPDQARDERGRWTSGGAAGAVAGATAEAAATDAFSVYAPRSIAGLSALAQRAFAGTAALLPEGAAAIGVAAAGSVAVVSTLFLPTNSASVATGTLPDAPEFSYKYDQDTGRLTVTRQNADGTSETVFSGHHDKDAIFRDENGNAIGRYLGDSVALDADAVRGYEARRKSDAQAPPGAIVQSTATTRSDPEVCPAPEPDKPGGKSNPGGVAYEEWVGEVVHGVVPPKQGLAIRMTKSDGDSVYLDNCVDETRSLIEAKGFTYGDALRDWRATNDQLWVVMEAKMMRQAASQVDAAVTQGWNLEWHFEDKDVADYMAEKFAERGYPIKVIHTPAPQDLIDQFGRILGGCSDELRHLFDLYSWNGHGEIPA
jgi:hypothetical protein